MKLNSHRLLLVAAVSMAMAGSSVAQQRPPPNGVPGGAGAAGPGGPGVPGGPGGFGGGRAAPVVLPAEPLVFDPSKKAGPQGDTWDSIKQLPDWSGNWFLDNASFARVRETTDSPNRDNPNVPKMTDAAWNYRMINKVENKGVDGTGANNNAAKCIPDGMPGIMSTPMGHEFLFTPGRVTIITENGEVRRIYTDGRRHATDPDLKFSGDEIGYWVNGVLYVETRSILPKAELFVGMPGDTGTVVVERMFKRSPKSTEIDTMVTSPKVFTQPFVYVRTYDYEPTFSAELCQENNRDNNGTIDLTPPPLN